MASSSQHRCVFVGNIPYDATEEQLVQICEEVGPVVSFRLVLDRETGKPKGYGFCEYKDEETALSARRNLQGYEINGRQLRVDFAENDKGTDRNREQGRGGPGLTTNIDAQKTSSGPPILGNSSIQQPIGLPIAANAASVMAGALGGVQASNMPIQNPSRHGADPLTLHLAKMSRNQLHDIMSEMKALVARDKPLALRVLQMCPQFPKALFQSQIMLGMVPQQMLQMPHIHQSGSSVMKPQISSDGQSITLPNTAQLPALQNAAQLGIYPRPQDGRMSMLPQNPLIPQQSSIQPRYQPLSNSIQPPTLPVTKGIVPVQPPLTQQPRPVASTNLGHQHHSLSAFANTSTQQPALPRPPASQNGSSSYAMNFSGLEGVSTEAVSSASLGYDSIQGSRPNLAMTSLEQVVRVNDVHESTIHPSKLARMEDGSRAPQILSSGAHAASSIPAQGSVSGLGFTGQVANIDGLHSEKQTTQCLPEAEAALLQQVMSLTAEQLNSLPPEQRQQVIQLQQMLRS